MAWPQKLASKPGSLPGSHFLNRLLPLLMVSNLNFWLHCYTETTGDTALLFRIRKLFRKHAEIWTTWMQSTAWSLCQYPNMSGSINEPLLRASLSSLGLLGFRSGCFVFDGYPLGFRRVLPTPPVIHTCSHTAVPSTPAPRSWASEAAWEGGWGLWEEERSLDC